MPLPPLLLIWLVYREIYLQECGQVFRAGKALLGALLAHPHQREAPEYFLAHIILPASQQVNAVKFPAAHKVVIGRY